MNKDEFYENGLQFSCQRCSACCRHDPGFVFLTSTDVDIMAAHFSMKIADFKNTYCRVVDFGFVTRLSLKEKENYDCIFWSINGCLLYEDRPLQCRSFPFWPRNLSTSSDWDDASKDCPGMNQGVLHTKKEISVWLNSYKESELLEE